jgi:hypothetical protein
MSSDPLAQVPQLAALLTGERPAVLLDEVDQGIEGILAAAGELGGDLALAPVVLGGAF